METLQTKYELFLVSGFIEDFSNWPKIAQNDPQCHEKYGQIIQLIKVYPVNSHLASVLDYLLR